MYSEELGVMYARVSPHARELTPADLVNIRNADMNWQRKMYMLALTAKHVPSVPHRVPTPAAHVVHTWTPPEPAGGLVKHVATALQKQHPQVPAHLWEPAITHVLQHPAAGPVWGIPTGLLLPPSPEKSNWFMTAQSLEDLGSFWSNPLGTIKHFISHPATTIVHAVKKAANNFTAKKVVQTAKVVAPIAAGAAALYFGAPYLASALSSAGGAISGAVGSVGSFITSEMPSLAGVGSTAAKWWSTQGQNAESYLSQLVNVPAVKTAAARGGVTVQDLMGLLQQHGPNIPASVASGGQAPVAAWLAQQQLGQQGIQMQSPAAVGLLNDRVAAEQATMQSSQNGSLPSNANQPNAAPVVAKKDWTKMALVGVTATGVLISAMKGGGGSS